MLKKILFNLIIILFFSNFANSETIKGKALVIDGDTIKINKKKIRFYGIDAPEIDQICYRNFLSISFLTFSKKYKCGLVAKKKLKIFLKEYNIKCLIRGYDKYNRKIAICYRDRISINSWMVKNGYAVAYKKYSKKYINFEEEAKKNNLGLWQGNFDMPWDWRKNGGKK